MTITWETFNRILLEELDLLKKEYSNGDKSKLLVAIRFCGRHKLIMPEWVVDEFHDATNKWYKHDEKELGEAFGLEFPKGKQKNSLKIKKEKRFAVYNRVTELHKQGNPIGTGMFEKVGAELNLCKTLISEYYYDVKGWEREVNSRPLQKLVDLIQKDGLTGLEFSSPQELIDQVKEYNGVDIDPNIIKYILAKFNLKSE